jgi:hypothetical protein
METYKVTFELVNGKTHTYEIADTAYDIVYTKINHVLDGWITFPHKGESHLIKADMICKVEIVPQSVIDERRENTAQALNSWNM